MNKMSNKIDWFQWVIRGVVGVMVLTILSPLIFFVLTMVFSGEAYSEGYRDVYVAKLSHKSSLPGIIGRTWEGRGVLPGQVGVGNEPWDFSVPQSGELIDELTALRGDELARLHYRQYLFWWPTKASTGYWVYRVERMPKEKR